jgi:hypothetical protein
MLDDERFEGRYLETLCDVTGTSEEHCKRLLIQIGARGVALREGPGWALISRMPFDQQ